MTPSVEMMKKVTCGCGRSPTGNCIGWHNLTQEQYETELEVFLEDQIRKEKEQGK